MVAPVKPSAGIVAREEKIKPLVRETLQLLETIGPICRSAHECGLSAIDLFSHRRRPLSEGPQDAREAKSNQAVAERIKTFLEVEQRLADFLRSPAQTQEIVKLNQTQLVVSRKHFSSAWRIYRYLIWQRRTFPATATPEVNGVAAVLRVKNEVHNLRVMLPSVLAYFDEVIVVDHNSTDDTYN